MVFFKVLVPYCPHIYFSAPNIDILLLVRSFLVYIVLEQVEFPSLKIYKVCKKSLELTISRNLIHCSTDSLDLFSSIPSEFVGLKKLKPKIWRQFYYLFDSGRNFNKILLFYKISRILSFLHIKYMEYLAVICINNCINNDFY